MTHDYRLFDALHAVLPTRLPREEFYKEFAGLYRPDNPGLVYDWISSGRITIDRARKAREILMELGKPENFLQGEQAARRRRPGRTRSMTWHARPRSCTMPKAAQPGAACHRIAMREDHEMSLGDHLEELRKCIMRSADRGPHCRLRGRGLLQGSHGRPSCNRTWKPGRSVEAAIRDRPSRRPPEGPPPRHQGGPPSRTLPRPSPARRSPATAERPPRLAPHILTGSPATGILAIIMVTTIVGVLAASPWVLYQIWSFVGVGLRDKERRFIRIYGPVSFLLFAAGAVLFYFVVLPRGLAALMAPALSIKVKGIPLIDLSVSSMTT